jgi:hypothetical protein
VIPTVCDKGRGGLPSCDRGCKAEGLYNNGSFPNCMPCPTGKRSNADGSNCVDDITQCPAGWEINDDGEACNRKCRAGTYNNGQMLLCLPCPSGMKSSEGASACIYEGMSSFAPAAACKECAALFLLLPLRSVCQVHLHTYAGQNPDLPQYPNPIPQSNTSPIPPQYHPLTLSAVCPAGTGSVPLCAGPCASGLHNPGNYTECQPCGPNRVSRDGVRCGRQHDFSGLGIISCAHRGCNSV